MSYGSQPAPVSKGALWTGYVLGVIPALMLVMSAVMKFLKPPDVMTGMVQLGWEESHLLSLGILELACTILYLIPQTSVLGAILLTGYLGGVVATHFRVHDPLWHVLTPVFLGVMLWLGLYLRDRRLRALAPLKS